MKKKICHISTAHSAYDTRIFYKECRSLASHGYDVNLIVTSDKDEVKEGVNIIHLPLKNDRFYRFFKKRKLALKKAINLDADIYHFHDPELMPVGIKLKKLGKKVIYDAHEDVSEQILTKEWLKNDFFRKLISKCFKIYEKRAVKYFDNVITVTSQIAEKFPKEKVGLVRNCPVLSEIDSIEPANEIIDYNNKTIVIYAGGLTKIRGIKEIIKSVEILDGKVELWLLGKWESGAYEKECMNEHGWKFVRYFGSIPQNKVYSYMKIANIGIVNFWPEKNHITALPNKPFEYMACSLPMVMSNFDYWQEVFKDCFVGANPLDPKDIAQKINVLIEDKEKAKTLGMNGRKLVRNKYSWESEQESLFEIYSNLSK